MSLITSQKSGKPPPRGVPPLENGDRLTRDEFERRYDAMPESSKAELIQGVVYMSSPVRYVQHGGPHADLSGWAAYYHAFTPGVSIADNTTVRLDLYNEPQPDVALFIESGRGGQVRIDEDGFITNAPEWIGEVSASSASYDLHAKLAVYRDSGVKEYVVWRVLDNALDWFILRQGQYDRLAPGSDGIHRSEIFPGLWLDSAALLRGDMAAVLTVLQQGLATPEHAAFVARLQEKV